MARIDYHDAEIHKVRLRKKLSISLPQRSFSLLRDFGVAVAGQIDKVQLAVNEK